MAVSAEKSRKEDSWAWVQIGVPFPDGPMRVKGEQNQYVALWYKHGKPVCGRAWNNGGVVECSFPSTSGKELTGKRDLGGEIQILTYETAKEVQDAWKQCGYWYEWVPWADRAKTNCQVVRCGDAAPILMQAKDGSTYSGNIEISTGSVMISVGGKIETSKAPETLLTIVRNYKDPGAKADLPKVYDDIWTDLREGDDWSRVANPIKAMDRALKGQAGNKANACVALWYQHGQPVMGSMWNEGGKLKAAFGWGGHAYTDQIGSVQVLVYDPSVAGFKVSWQPYTVATKKGSGWRPVKVKDCAPCVIVDKAGVEHLGRVQISEEKASFPEAGKEVVFVGPQVQQFMVLCRTD